MMIIVGKRKWKIKNSIQEPPSELREEFSLSPLTAGLLVERGVKTVSEAKLFFHGTGKDLTSPFCLDGMEKAVERLASALKKKERILIYGDYDVDGLTSVALILRTLRRLKEGNIIYYIPKRLEEGYGLCRDILARAVKNGCRLVLTVDCGITACEEADFLKSRGVDLLITDHHEPGTRIPEAAAVVNPKTTPGYHDRNLAGVGVTFKLLQGLAEVFPEIQATLWENIDLVALGTIADIVPLVGENRILVKEGLKVMQNTANPGLRAMFDLCGISGKKLASWHISFLLAPRLNAAGRLGDPVRGLRLLLATEPRRAGKLAGELDELNKKRQKIEQMVMKEAEEVLAREEPGKAIVLGGENWHPGVIGIVASRLVDKYYRPVVLFSLAKDKGKGSARSIPGFHIFKAFNACSSLLEKFGGHELAAGLEVSRGKMEDFKQTLSDLADSWLSSDLLCPFLEIEKVVSLEELTLELAGEVATLAPFGAGNPEPVLACLGVNLLDVNEVGKDGRHLKIKIGNGTVSRHGIGFNFGAFREKLSVGKRFDLAFHLTENDWDHKVQLILKDIQPTTG